LEVLELISESTDRVYRVIFFLVFLTRMLIPRHYFTLYHDRSIPHPVHCTVCW